MSDTITRRELVDLAKQAANGDGKALARIKSMAWDLGYEGRGGGHIYDANGGHAGHGWRALAAAIAYGEAIGVRFIEALAASAPAATAPADEAWPLNATAVCTVAPGVDGEHSGPVRPYRSATEGGIARWFICAGHAERAPKRSAVQLVPVDLAADEVAAYAADPTLWAEGQADIATVYARRQAARDGILPRPIVPTERGQAVRHVELGTLGVFDRYEDGGACAYVWFADDDYPYRATLVHPGDIVRIDLPEARRTAGRFDPSCPACAQYVEADAAGNTLPHVRRGDTSLPMICSGSGRPRFAHSREGLVRAELLGPDLKPMSIAAHLASGDEVAHIAVIRIGSLDVVVTHDDETPDGDRLREAIDRTAGYELGYPSHPYNNLVDDGAGIMLRPTDEILPEQCDDCETTGYNCSLHDGPEYRDDEPAVDEHVTEIEGPDSAGHFEWVCTRRDAEQTGLDLAAAVAAAAAHGPLSVGSWGLIKRLRGDIPGGGLSLADLAAAVATRHPAVDLATGVPIGVYRDGTVMQWRPTRSAEDDVRYAREAELAALRAAVDLHRPKLLDKYGQPTTDPAAAKWIRCGACSESVPAAGCATWRTAHPATPDDEAAAADIGPHHGPAVREGAPIDPRPGDVWCDTSLRSDVDDRGVMWHARLDNAGDVELYEPNGPGLIPAADVRRIRGGMVLISRDEAAAADGGCEARSDSITDLGPHRGPVALVEGPETGELVFMCLRHVAVTGYLRPRCAEVRDDRGDHTGAITRATLTAAGGRLVDRFGRSPGDPIALCQTHAQRAAAAGEVEPVTPDEG